MHTARAPSVLDLTKEALCVAGHHCFRHLGQAVFDGPVRQESSDRDGSADALAVLALGGDVPCFEAAAMG
ncbi:hypothetical protein AB0A98_06030 [Streptomyces chrestomyceticus]|uniref:hypothetical protein n=1 Tax=Streptomyces chrestomyceticus TaxID=68185 RepID=UPI0033E2C5CA